MPRELARPPAGALLPPLPYCTAKDAAWVQSKGAGKLPQFLFIMSLAVTAVNWAMTYMVVLLIIDSREWEVGATRNFPALGVVSAKLKARWPFRLLVVGLTDGPVKPL